MRTHEEVYALIYRNHKQVGLSKGLSEDAATRAANIVAVKLTHPMYLFLRKATGRKHWTAYSID